MQRQLTPSTQNHKWNEHNMYILKIHPGRVENATQIFRVFVHSCNSASILILSIILFYKYPFYMHSTTHHSVAKEKTRMEYIVMHELFISIIIRNFGN